MPLIKTTYPARCPKCDADLEGAEIPESIRENYSPPYRFGRVIAVTDRDRDAFDRWRCPDCKHEWR
jgi:predicted Zn-ribbon and HTH transcriptional regulator